MLDRPQPRYRVRSVWGSTGHRYLLWYRVQWRDPWGAWVTVHRALRWRDAMNWANTAAQEDWDE